MSYLTTLTRAILTRSFKPFEFKSEYDKQLPFTECENIGLYVHIPFCKQICSFCPYCKQIYNKKECNEYIEYLIKEINMVGKQLLKRKEVTSLYFGGGTPTLVSNRIKEIIDTIKKYFIITEGIGIELHPDNVDEETLLKLHEAGINKISIGIQSFSDKYLSILNRNSFDKETIANALKKNPFETISMDFIFALPKQTVEDLKSDINTAFSIGANHIAIYPFIDFNFTNSNIKPMSKNEKRKLLDDITLYCEEMGYKRNSIWTFSNKSNASYSSMTRDNFLGFGCSATTLLFDQFKINTFSVSHYIERLKQNILPTSLTVRFTKRQRMIYYLFWTAYSTRINPKDFEKFFDIKLNKMYGLEFWLAKKLGYITKKDGVYHMTLKGAFYYHHYENYYTLAYIDKMWGIMRKEAFPTKITM